MCDKLDDLYADKRLTLQAIEETKKRISEGLETTLTLSNLEITKYYIQRDIDLLLGTKQNV